MTRHVVQTGRRVKIVIQQNSQLYKILHRMEKKALDISFPFSIPLRSGYSNILNLYPLPSLRKNGSHQVRILLSS